MIMMHTAVIKCAEKI